MLLAKNHLLTLRITRDRRLSPSSRMIYQAMNAHVKTTAKEYAAAFDIPVGTIRRCLAELQRCGWVYSYRTPGKREVIYTTSMPLDVEQEVADLAEKLADTAANRGEFIMKMMLDTLVNDPNFIDNARFRWTRLGTVLGRLEFDRYYPDRRVAVEFHGRQHYEEVEFNGGKSDLAAQQTRDGLKALACLRQQVTLIEIADTELSYDRVIAKLTDHLPLLPIRMDRPLFRTIANLAADYTRWARQQRVHS